MMEATPLPFSPVRRTSADEEDQSYMMMQNHSSNFMMMSPTAVASSSSAQQQHINNSRGIFSPITSLKQLSEQEQQQQDHHHHHSSFKEQFNQIRQNRQNRLLRQGKSTSPNNADHHRDQQNGSATSLSSKRPTSPIRERANLTTNAFHSTLADIDRRTRRTEVYLIKKYENVERRNEVTRHHRVAKDVASYYHNNNNNNNNNTNTPIYSDKSATEEAGNKIRAIQEEINRRSLQSENVIRSSEYLHHDRSYDSHQQQQQPKNQKSKVTSIQQMLRADNNRQQQETGARALGYDFVGLRNHDDEDGESFSAAADTTTTSNENNNNNNDPYGTNALRKRLEEARRSTEASVKTLFTTAIHALTKRENEARAGISADQTQQFARLTVLKALQYASVFSPVAATRPQQNDQENDQDHQEEEVESAIEKYRRELKEESAARTIDTTEKQQRSEITTSDETSMSPNNRTEVHGYHRETVEYEEQQQQQEPQEQSHSVAHEMKESFETPQKHQQQQSSSSLPRSTGRSTATTTTPDRRQQQDLLLLRELFVLENFFKAESRIRLTIEREAFDGAFNLAFSSRTYLPPASSNNTNDYTTNKTSSPSSTKNSNATKKLQADFDRARADRKVLTDMFVVENFIRRECEQRQKLADESLDAQILILSDFHRRSFSTLMMVESNRNSNNNNNNEEDVKIAASSPTNNNNKSNYRKEAKLLQRELNNSATDQTILRQMYVAENFQLREARERINLLMGMISATGCSSLLSEDAFAAAMNFPHTKNQADENSSSSLTKEQRNNDDVTAMRQLFLVQNVEHRESKKRQEILLDAMQEISAIFASMVGIVTIISSSSPATASTTTSPRSRPRSAASTVRAREDTSLLRSMVVIDNLQAHEAHFRQSILLQALTETYVLFQQHSADLSGIVSSLQHSSTPPSIFVTPSGAKIIEIPKSPAENDDVDEEEKTENNHSDPSADKENINTNNSDELRSVIILETVVLRESEQRNVLESESWEELLFLLRENERSLIQMVINNSSSSSSSSKISRSARISNSSNNKANRNNNAEIFRSCFILEVLKKNEAETRSEIAQEALMFFASCSGWRMDHHLNSSLVPAQSSNTNSKDDHHNNHHHHSHSHLHEDVSALRLMFVVENLKRRESEARTNIQEDSLSQMMNLILTERNEAVLGEGSPVRSLRLRPQSGVSTTSTNSTSSSRATMNDSNFKIVRQLFLHENMFHRETNSRNSIFEQENSLRYQMVLAFYVVSQQLLTISSTHTIPTAAALSSPSSARFSSASSPSRPTSAPSANHRSDSLLLRQLFIVESFEKKETEKRHSLEQQQFAGCLEISNVMRTSMLVLMNSTVSSSTNNTVQPAKSANSSSSYHKNESRILREMFTQENFFHRESKSRSEIAQGFLAGLLALHQDMNCK